MTNEKMKKYLKRIGLIGSFVLLLWFIIPPGPIFPDKYSRLVLDRDGDLLLATLAEDQQYRFPTDRMVLPDKYIRTVLEYEDKRFYYHPGVDPFALLTAAWSNMFSGQRIRGASTITMQVARLADQKPRTYFNKLIESLMALRITLHYSKEEVLRLYATQVPMGGNLVGIQAASYYYFGKPVKELTWAESALFTVIPNNPSMINLRRGRSLLLAKRNRLLNRLFDKGIIDASTYRLSLLEKLPDKKHQLPFTAPHFARWILNKDKKSGPILTSLDAGIQKQVKNATDLHYNALLHQGIRNISVLVCDNSTGKIRAYLGSQSFSDSSNAGQVDGVQAYRSTGSLLKPFLTACVLDRGPFTMKSHIQDVPTFYGTFLPQNADKVFRGLVSLETMLIRSLNVPFVRLLNTYGINDFYDYLKTAGFKGLFRPAGNYGLSLILGGAEASLFELVQLYQSLAHKGSLQPLRWMEAGDANAMKKGALLNSRGAAWLVINTLKDLSRPGIEHYYPLFSENIPVAWKTGTSYGQRDAWAIGINKQWTIGVWVGNFEGDGNAALSGASSAAPLLFALFNTLTVPEEEMWFKKPEDDLEYIICCNESGLPAGGYCPQTIEIEKPRQAYIPGTCPFHRRFLVDARSGDEVCSLCWVNAQREWRTRYIIPPLVQDIMVRNGYAVDPIPPHKSTCSHANTKGKIQLVYPVNGIRIFVPRDLDGNFEKVVFSALHQQNDSYLFWYLNGELIGETKKNHTLAVSLNQGSYRLTIQDEEGNTKSVRFSAYRNKELAQK